MLICTRYRNPADGPGRSSPFRRTGAAHVLRIEARDPPLVPRDSRETGLAAGALAARAAALTASARAATPRPGLNILLVMVDQMRTPWVYLPRERSGRPCRR